MVIKPIKYKEYEYDIVVPDDDLIGCGRVVLKKGIWEPTVSKYIYNNLNEGDVFVDAGAAIGWHTMLASQIVRNEGKVFSIEPNRLRMKAMTYSRDINKYDNIILCAFGISDKTEEMYLGYKNLGRLYYDDKKGVPVTVTTIDECVPYKIDMMKIDVEGMELLVLKGAEGTIKMSPNIKIILESHSRILRKQYKSTNEDFYSYIDELGLTSTTLERGRMVLTYE